MKICPSCNIDKSLDEYYRDSTIAECKECFRIRMRRNSEIKRLELKKVKDEYRDMTIEEIYNLVDDKNITLQEFLNPLFN